MGFSTKAGQADVELTTNIGVFRREVGEAGAIYARTTGAMSTASLRAAVAHERLTRTIAHSGPASTQAKNATVAYRREMQALEGTSRRAGSAIDREERSLSKLVRGAAAGSGVLGRLRGAAVFASTGFIGGAGLAYALKTVIAQSSTLQEETEKTGVVFGKSAADVQHWSRTLALSFGVGEGAALKAAGVFGNMFNALKIGDAAGAKMSKRLVELAADMASFNNASPDDVLKAIQSGIAGQVRPLRQYGVFLSEAALKEEAFADGIAKRGKTLNSQQKTLAAYNLILRQTARQQGDVARNTGSLSVAESKLRAELQDSEATIGRSVLPTETRLINRGAVYLDRLNRTGRLQRDVNHAMRTGTQIVHGLADAFHIAHSAITPVTSALGGTRRTVELVALAYLTLKAKQKALGLLGLVSDIKKVATAWRGVEAAAGAAGAAESGAGGIGGGGGVAKKVEKKAGSSIAKDLEQGAEGAAGGAAAGGVARAAIGGLVLRVGLGELAAIPFTLSGDQGPASEANLGGLRFSSDRFEVLTLRKKDRKFVLHIFDHGHERKGIAPAKFAWAFLSDTRADLTDAGRQVLDLLNRQFAGQSGIGAQIAEDRGQAATRQKPPPSPRGTKPPRATRDAERSQLRTRLAKADEALIVAGLTASPADDLRAYREEEAAIRGLLRLGGQSRARRIDLEQQLVSATEGERSILDARSQAARDARDKRRRAAEAARRKAEEAARKRDAALRAQRQKRVRELTEVPIDLRIEEQQALAHHAGEERLLAIYRKELAAIEKQLKVIRAQHLGKDAVLKATQTEAAVQKKIDDLKAAEKKKRKQQQAADTESVYADAAAEARTYGSSLGRGPLSGQDARGMLGQIALLLRENNRHSQETARNTRRPKTPRGQAAAGLAHVGGV